MQTAVLRLWQDYLNTFAFNKVPEWFAYEEGERDRSLAYLAKGSPELLQAQLLYRR
jgi:uncharacterized protein YhfF